eukprot:Rmarinus@m.8993
MFIFGATLMTDAMEIMLLSSLSVEVGCVWNLPEWQKAFISTAVFVGMSAGAAVWGLTSDRFGRRNTYMLVTTFTFVAGLVSASARSYPVLLLLRGLVGFGVGGSHVALTLFVEFMPKHSRAYSLLGLEVFWGIGSAIETVIAWFFLTNTSTLGWRRMLLVTSAPFFFILFLFPFVPDSPHYLLVKGDREGALRVLKDAASSNRRVIPPHKVLAPVMMQPEPPSESSISSIYSPREVSPSPSVQSSSTVGTSSSNCSITSVESSSEMEESTTVRRGQLEQLVMPTIRKTTILLWVVWFGCTLIYFGIFLLITKLFSLENAGVRCPEYHSMEGSIGTT